MLDTLKAFVASHFTILFAAWLATAIASFFVRTLASAKWQAFEKAHPAIGGLLHLLFGFLTNVDQVRAGIVLIAKAFGWQPPTGGDGTSGTKPTDPPGVVVKLASMLMLAASLVFFGATQPACAGALPAVNAVVTDAECVLPFFPQLESAWNAGAGPFGLAVALVAHNCNIDRQLVVQIFGHEKASRALRAKQAAEAAPACSSSATLSTPVRP